jgi:hypothetical protein
VTSAWAHENFRNEGKTTMRWAKSIRTFAAVIAVATAFDSASGLERGPGWDALQQGHQRLNDGDVEGAKREYERALSLDPELGAAKLSLKKATRLLSYRANMKYVNDHCDSIETCFSKFAVYRDRPLHPAIVEAFIGRVSDAHGPIVTQINLDDAKDSNAFCCETSFDWLIDESGLTRVRMNVGTDFSTIRDTDCRGLCEWTYEIVGSPGPGVVVLDVVAYNSGTYPLTAKLVVRIATTLVLQNGVWHQRHVAQALSIRGVSADQWRAYEMMTQPN